MNKGILLVAAVLMAATFAYSGQQPGGRPLSPQETDQAINNVFSGAAGVTRMEADLITQKVGGMVREGQRSFEFLRLEAPARMYLENRGSSEGRVSVENSTLIIVDGRNIWEVEAKRQGARERAVSRRGFRPNIQGGQSGMAVFIGMFLMGREVSSAGDLRQTFDIAAVEEPIPGRRETTNHFTLTPRAGGETLELWILPGQSLPWKVRSFERKEIKFPPPKPGEPPRFKVEETVRVLRNVKTNQSGLGPFQAEAFMLPLAQDMVVRDEQTNQIVSHDLVRRELEEVRREYQQQGGRQ